MRATKARATRQTRTIGAITATLGHANVGIEFKSLQRLLMNADYVLHSRTGPTLSTGETRA